MDPKDIYLLTPLRLKLQGLLLLKGTNFNPIMDKKPHVQ